MQFKLTLIKEYSLTILLVLFYLSEGLNKCFIFLFGEETFAAKIIKGTLLFLCTAQLIFHKRNWHSLLLLVTLIFIFLLGQFSLSPNFDRLVVLNTIKYLFPLVLFMFFNNIAQSKRANMTLFEVFEKIVLLNTALIFIGFLLDINFLESYKGSRFGFNGLIVTSATSTYFYTIAIFHYLVKYKSLVFKDVYRIFVFLGILLVGTKSLYFVLILFFIIYTYLYAHKKIKIVVFLIFLSVLAIAGYYFTFEAEIFKQITQQKGVLASITSLRSLILIEEMLPFIYQNWSLENYLFGGISQVSSRPQMALFDLFYFFGAFGTITYLLTYVKNYFIFKVSRNELIFYAIIFLISLIAGNFFINATVTIYMLIFRESIKSFSSQ